MSKPPHSLIGYLAAFSRYELLCDGDACIIAGSEAKLKDYLTANNAALPKRYEIKKVRFDDLLRGLRAGPMRLMRKPITGSIRRRNGRG